MHALLALIMLIICAPASAQTPNLTVEQKEFITLYKKIAAAKDKKNYLNLIHPEVRACMSQSHQIYVQDDFWEKAVSLENIDINTITIHEIDLPTLESEIQHFYRDKAFLSVQPQHELSAYIDPPKTPDTCARKPPAKHVKIPIAFYNGKWYEVLPCGKNDLESFLAKQLAAKQEQETRVVSLYNALDKTIWNDIDPLLTKDHNLEKAAITLQQKEKLSRTMAGILIEKRCDNL